MTAQFHINLHSYEEINESFFTEHFMQYQKNLLNDDDDNNLELLDVS